ncbi:MAG: PaREP1 family protein [Methanophagales archaeon]|nr:PaREP1 family protein [Methanophagales archaeon]
MKETVQATEKLWGASALAVKSVAAKRGLKLEEHGSLWSFVNVLAIEMVIKTSPHFSMWQIACIGTSMGMR